MAGIESDLPGDWALFREEPDLRVFMNVGAVVRISDRGNVYCVQWYDADGMKLDDKEIEDKERSEEFALELMEVFTESGSFDPAVK